MKDDKIRNVVYYDNYYFDFYIYRVFTFFDKGKLILTINGFQKKSQKTPTKKIALAEKIKKQYFNETNK